MTRWVRFCENYLCILLKAFRTIYFKKQNFVYSHDGHLEVLWWSDGVCANTGWMGQRVNRLPNVLLSSSFSVMTQVKVSPMFPHRWAAVHPQVPCLKRASACCSSSSATSLGVNLTVLAGKQSSTWGVQEMKGGKGDEKSREEKSAEPSKRSTHVQTLCRRVRSSC